MKTPKKCANCYYRKMPNDRNKEDWCWRFIEKPNVRKCKDFVEGDHGPNLIEHCLTQVEKDLLKKAHNKSDKE